MKLRRIFPFVFLITVFFSCTACTKSIEIINDISKESDETSSHIFDTESIDTMSASDTASNTAETGSTTEKYESYVIYPFYGTPEEEVIYPYFLESGIIDPENGYYFNVRYRWDNTVPIEGYFIDGDGRVTDLDGNSEWDESTDVAGAMLKLSHLNKMDIFDTVYVGDHVVKIGENGKLYKYDDNLLLVWKPLKENRNNSILSNAEYNTETYHLATVFYDNENIWYPLASSSLEESFIFDGVEYTHCLDDPFTGYYIYDNGNIEKYSGFLEDETTILDEALEQLDSLEYLGAFKKMSLVNGLEYEYKLYRYKDGLITLNRLYLHQIYDTDMIDVYNEVMWWKPNNT